MKRHPPGASAYAHANQSGLPCIRPTGFPPRGRLDPAWRRLFRVPSDRDRTLSSLAADASACRALIVLPTRRCPAHRSTSRNPVENNAPGFMDASDAADARAIALSPIALATPIADGHVGRVGRARDQATPPVPPRRGPNARRGDAPLASRSGWFGMDQATRLPSRSALIDPLRVSIVPSLLQLSSSRSSDLVHQQHSVRFGDAESSTAARCCRSSSCAFD